jgi:single-strand DNA-binding protein
MSVNIAILTGKIARDVKAGISKNGNDWASFSLKVTDLSKDQKLHTSFVDIVCFGPSAQFVKNKRIGDDLFIQGSLQTNSYEDKTGHKIQRTQIAAKKITSVEDPEDPEATHEPLFED